MSFQDFKPGEEVVYARGDKRFNAIVTCVWNGKEDMGAWGKTGAYMALKALGELVETEMGCTCGMSGCTARLRDQIEKLQVTLVNKNTSTSLPDEESIGGRIAKEDEKLKKLSNKSWASLIKTRIL